MVMGQAMGITEEDPHLSVALRGPTRQVQSEEGWLLDRSKFQTAWGRV